MQMHTLTRYFFGMDFCESLCSGKQVIKQNIKLNNMHPSAHILNILGSIMIIFLIYFPYDVPPRIQKTNKYMSFTSYEKNKFQSLSILSKTKEISKILVHIRECLQPTS